MILVGSSGKRCLAIKLKLLMFLTKVCGMSLMQVCVSKTLLLLEAN